MSKLQLYITKSFKGYKVLFNVNPSEEITAHVKELRSTVGLVDYDSSEKNIFYLLTSVESGTFITVLRTIPTEKGDHLAAWIYVPGNMIIDGHQLARVVAMTTRKVSGERVTAEDTTELRELFSTDYPVDPEAPEMAGGNPRGAMAWRKYNGDSGVTLEDLFGKGLFQQYYLDYSGVMLVDGDLGVSVDGADLTETPIGEPAVILPPEKNGQGFMAHVFGRILDRPMRGTMECNLPIVWRRNGFEDVEDAQVVHETPFTPVAVDTSNSRKQVSVSTFQITGQNSSRPIEFCQILVNGVEVSAEPHYFTQAELAQASVVINHEGYYPYTAHLDLASTTRALVMLRERQKIYKFEMPVKSSDLGSPVEFTIYSKKPLTDSPLEGYSLLGDIQEGESRVNRLGYSGGSGTWLQKLIFLAIGLGMGLIISVGLSKCGSSSAPAAATSNGTTAVTGDTDTVTNGDQQQPVASAAGTTKTDKPAAGGAVTAEAIAYLDNNKVWTKDKLESFPGLVGLFDDLNNYRTDVVVKTWKPKLAMSKVFSNLAQHMSDGRNKPKAKALQGTQFDKSGKGRITVQQYLWKINP